MEVYVCSRGRHVLLVTLVLLAVLGNEPHRTVHAQVGTTKLRSETTLAAPAGGRTTVVPGRTTKQGQAYRTTQVAGQPYVTTNAAPVGGVTQRATGVVLTGAVTAPAVQSTVRAGAAVTQAPVGATTARAGGGAASTQRAAGVPSTQRPAGATQPAGTTQGATVSTASPPKITEFDIEYIFKILSPLKGNENACISESTKDLANTFGISTSRVTGVTCTQTGNDTIKVTARITAGTKPTVEDLENFKTRVDYTTVQFNGWQNRGGEINRGSFNYAKVTATSAKSSQNWLLGLSETHWIMIGMGSVILLLFIVSITIICVGRRGGEASPERMDEEASAASGADSEEDETPKKKWYSFLQRRKKGDDDSDGNRTDDESAYESAKGDDGSESDQDSEKIHDDHKVV